MESIKRNEIGKGVYFTTINTNKFKTTRLTVSFIVPLTKEDAVSNTLVSAILTRSTKSYPSYTVLSKRLCELYGANLSTSVRKSGDNQVISFVISGIDDKYAFQGDRVLEDMSKLLCDVIFNPKLDGEAFCQEEYNQERRQFQDALDSEFNNKRTYLINKATEVMCSNEPYGLSRIGTAEDAEKTTPANLYQKWQSLMDNSRVEIFYVGESSSEKSENIFAECFANENRTFPSVNSSVVYDVKEVKNKKEVLDITQSKMFMGFRTGKESTTRDIMAMRLAVTILGGTAHSKLFNNVREKLSLCYYCSARYVKPKGIMIVDSGVEKENIDKAQKAILAEIEDMKNGNITDFEIDSAKLSLCNDFVSLTDSESGLENWYFAQALCDSIISPNEVCDIVKEITKEEIVEKSKKFLLDTIYVLESK